MKLKSREDHQQIGELARSLGITTRTLRLYEQLGLIDPPQRTEGGIRYYTKEDIRRIKFVLKVKELGLSLRQMQELAEIYRQTKMPDRIMPRLIEILDSHTDAIHRKIGKLSSLARDISEYRKRIVEYYGIPR
jgi:DNA-binding transcriptional MerR regulator